MLELTKGDVVQVVRSDRETKGRANEGKRGGYFIGEIWTYLSDRYVDTDTEIRVRRYSKSREDDGDSDEDGNYMATFTVMRNEVVKISE